MSNEIKTHRLIVTLPDTAGEEADEIAQAVEDFLGDATNAPAGATVTHALGESLPVGIRVKTAGSLEPVEARQLAGVLLAHAETIEDAE